MPAMNQPDSSYHAYIIDPEKAAEMARLQQQNRIITMAMGGLLPECSDFSQVRSILDLGCGPGDWALDLAYAHPEVEIVGVDISQRMITYASAQQRPNIQFHLMDITSPLEFPDQHFDIINARTIASAVPKYAWPQLIQECKRLLRPGGLLRLAELERALTNSSACERYNRFITQAWFQAEHTFSCDGDHIGIQPMLSSFLEDAGCQHIKLRAFAIDFSARAPAHVPLFENLRMSYLLVQPYLIKMGVASENELVEVYNQALKEMQEPAFHGLLYILVAWGEKTSQEHIIVHDVTARPVLSEA